MPIVTSLKERIDELERVVAQQRRFAVRVRTQNAVSKILSTSANVDDAIAGVLETISAGLSWELALFWSLDTSAKVMRCAQVCQAAADFDSFVQVSRGFVFSRGMGLPGEVWARKAAVSLSDIQESENFPRLPLARACGLHGAFAFPVILDDAVVGVIEAFTREHTGIDEDLLAALSAMGLQIGRFLGRKEGERALKLKEQTYRILAETAPDAILTIDSTGRILFANTAASALFGHSTEELTRVHLSTLMPHHLREQYTAAIRDLPSVASPRSWRSISLLGLHKDGRQLQLDVSCAAFSAEGLTLFTGFIRDANERSHRRSA